MNRLWHLVSALRPAASPVDFQERLRAALGAAVGIIFTALVGQASMQLLGSPLWLAAPIGASAVLVFALPASPLAQPWPVLMGNALSALVGWGCAHLIPDPAWAASTAVAAAIGTMFLARCLHPPGGGVAVLAVLAQPMDLGPLLGPVMLNSLLMVIAGVAYNNTTRRRYPHTQQPHATTTPVALPASSSATRFTAADFDAALAHYNQVVDMSRDDLEVLLQRTEAAAYQRTIGSLKCGDIMSTPPVSIELQATPQRAQALMAQQGIKALPVVDGEHQVVGILTTADLVRRGTDKASVQELMTRPAQTASVSQWVTELLPIYSEQGHHHLPVVDAQKRLVGMVTQTDMVRALHRAVHAPPEPVA